jgi:hypothetical protein
MTSSPISSLLAIASFTQRTQPHNRPAGLFYS